MCVFYKCEECYLRHLLCRIQPILKLKLQMHSRMNRGELNNMFCKVITISQMSSQLDSYPDDSWVMICGHQPLFHVNATKTPCKVGTISPQQWPDGLYSQPLLNILLADRGHLLCQICTLRVQSGSLLIITLCFIPFCWQVLSGLWFFAPTTISGIETLHCLIKPGPKERRGFGWVCCLELLISISRLTLFQLYPPSSLKIHCSSSLGFFVQDANQGGIYVF